jgi:NAD(P)-dependent dehydrogenase (short-subunit alcohol dehydrogenase family)
MIPVPDHGQKSYKGSGRLAGKAALITGADSGIGKAVAIAFAREGADVMISYLDEAGDARDTADWVQRAGRKAVLAPGDIGEEKHCRDLVDRAWSEFGKLDLLVNNAAYQAVHETIEEWSAEEWRRTFRTNIDGMFYLCKAAMPRMAPGSVVINTSSVQAYQPSGHLLGYAVTKGAIVTFTQALAELGAKRGIRVNSVAPGPVWTPLIPTTFPPEKIRKFGDNSLFGRPAQPAELAPAFVFLAIPDSSYVTGCVVDMTGGRMLP